MIELSVTNEEYESLLDAFVLSIIIMENSSHECDRKEKIISLFNKIVSLKEESTPFDQIRLDYMYNNFFFPACEKYNKTLEEELPRAEGEIMTEAFIVANAEEDQKNNDPQQRNSL